MAIMSRSDIQAATQWIEGIQRALDRGRKSGVVGVHRTSSCVRVRELNGARGLRNRPYHRSAGKYQKTRVHVRWLNTRTEQIRRKKTKLSARRVLFITD